MSTTCRKDPAGFTCAKEKIDPQKSTEAELWLNMMTSMLNFAMASTTLMKSIQNRVDVTKKLEEEARAMKAAEFFKQELARSMPEKNEASEDFSLRAQPVREDTCGQHTCTLVFRKKEPDECGPSCDGKKSPGPTKLSKKKKPCQVSVETIGGSCMCLIPLPEEPSEAELPESKSDEDTCSCNQIKACMQPEEDDDEEPPCVCSDDDVKGKIDCEPQVICPAAMSLDDLDESDDCSCPSYGCKEDVAAEEPPVVEVFAPPAAVEEAPEELPEKEDSIIDCGCQTTSSEEIMVKELQLANLAYQLRQTDKNLKELKREMDRISNFVGGKKKCSYATAAALYEEIMKPRTSLDEVPKSSSRRKRR